MTRLLRCPHCTKVTVLPGPRGYAGWCTRCRALVDLDESVAQAKLTRRELILIWLSVAGNVAQVIQTGIAIHDHRLPKPRGASIARVVTEKVMISGSISVSMTGVAAVSAVGTVTVIQQPTSLAAAAKAGIALAVLVAGPVGVRKAFWQIRVHPKKLAEVPAGRLRWKLLRLPKAPDSGPFSGMVFES
jgi:hypothetical protein